MIPSTITDEPTGGPVASSPEREFDAARDRQAISDQVARYAYTFDASDAEGWAGLFTDDGVFEVILVGADQPIFRAQGTEQLRAFVRGAPRLLHHIGGLVVDELHGDCARSRAMVLGTWTSPDDGSPAIYTHGTYEQSWCRAGGTWRIAHQRFISHGYHPAAFRATAAPR